MNKYIQALYSISPDISHADWLRVSFSARAAGVSFSIWEDWCKNGKAYDKNSSKAVWNSYRDGKGITAGTLIHYAKKHGYVQKSFERENVTAPKEKLLLDKKQLQSVESKFSNYPDAPSNHPYILKKGGWEDGLKMVPLNSNEKIGGISLAGALVVPYMDGLGLNSLQYITMEHKLNMPRAELGEGYFLQGIQTNKIYVVEGVGQMWSAGESTGYASASTFGVLRTKRVIIRLMQNYPDSEIIVVANLGQEQYIEKIATELQIKFIFMPSGWAKNSDINDLMQRDGIPALKSILDNPQSVRNSKDLAVDKINQRKNAMRENAESILIHSNATRHIDGIAHAGHHTVLFGPSGSFKTTFLTALCLHALDKNEGLEVHYWGFDVSPPYAMAVVSELAHDRFSLFSNQTIIDMKSFYAEYFQSKLRLDNVIIVLDTFKFLSSDVNNKNANKEAMHYIKGICKLGAAWISLAHTNKDGKRESGTAEIEQDSDAVLRIDNVIEGNKGIANIKKAGRCRWGDTSITIETIISSEDKERPHLFWADAIRNAKVVDNVDISSLIKSSQMAPDMEIIAKIIYDYKITNRQAINKTELSKLIKLNEFITLTAREIDPTLKAGTGKYWIVSMDKQNHNRQLYSSI